MKKNNRNLKFNAVSWFTTGRPVAVASASLLPASSIWNGKSVALDTTWTAEIKEKGKRDKKEEEDEQEDGVKYQEEDGEEGKEDEIKEE